MFKLLFFSLVLNLLAQVKYDEQTNGENIGILVMGTIVQKKDPSRSVALIKENGSGKVYAVKPGNPVKTDYTVKEISQKYLVLLRGQKKILVFQQKFAGDFQNRTPDPATNNSQSLALQSHYKEEGFERNNQNVRVTASFRDKLVNQDLAKVLMQATAEPMMQNGQIIGFQLSQIEKDSIYSKGGLLDNDVITSINGVKLNSVGGAVGLLQSLKKEENIEIDILRNGSPTKIQLNVN